VRRVRVTSLSTYSKMPALTSDFARLSSTSTMLRFDFALIFVTSVLLCGGVAPYSSDATPMPALCLN
jgi:hypothetical protein